MKSCIYIGMASDDVDVSDLVDTIAVTAREIEENSRVCKINQFHVFPKFCNWTWGGGRGKLSVHFFLSQMLVLC